MHLVNGLGGAQRVAAGAVLHPVLVAPLVIEVPDDGGSAGRFFVQQAERVGLVDAVSVALRFDVELIERAARHSGEKSFPDAGRAARTQGIRLGSPLIEA